MVTTADIRRLQDQAQMLRERLHRVSVALAMTEDMLAIHLDRMVYDDGARASNGRLSAEHARAAAADCRAFAARLAEEQNC